MRWSAVGSRLKAIDRLKLLLFALQFLLFAKCIWTVIKWRCLFFTPLQIERLFQLISIPIPISQTMTEYFEIQLFAKIKKKKLKKANKGIVWLVSLVSYFASLHNVSHFFCCCWSHQRHWIGTFTANRRTLISNLKIISKFFKPHYKKV